MNAIIADSNVSAQGIKPLYLNTGHSQRGYSLDTSATNSIRLGC